MTEDIKAFCDYLNKQVTHHSLYLWGGQGEPVEQAGLVDVRGICRKEVDKARANTVLEKLSDCYLSGYDMSLANFYDCSGLGVAYFLEKGYISRDMTANDLYNICTTHPELEELKAGDFVFKNKGASGWGHIGYIKGYGANGDPIVVEARGRAYGVCARALKEGNWQATGRPDFWSGESPEPVFVRTLYYRKGDLMRGDDVLAVQTRLDELFYEVGELDGIFGLNTREAVIDYQIEKGLEVDGVVGRITWDSLFHG